MDITGKIILALPEVTGTSKAGNAWKKREYVLETQETYPKKVYFDFFGERADQYPLNPGDVIKLSFDIESREYNGRWFTSIRGWKAEPAVAAAPAGFSQGAPTFPTSGQAPATSAYGTASTAPAQGSSLSSVSEPLPGDDLPF